MKCTKNEINIYLKFGESKKEKVLMQRAKEDLPIVTNNYNKGNKKTVYNNFH